MWMVGRPGFTKNRLNEKKHFEKLASEVIDDFSRNELRESHAAMQELTSQIYRSCRKEWICFHDSGEFQDVESICSGKLSRSQSTGNCSKSFWDATPRPKSAIWYLEFLDTSGNVFGNPRAVIESSSTPYQRMLHSWNQSATGGNVRDGTGKLVTWSEERNRETIPTPRFGRKPSTMNSFFPAEGSHPQNYVADQQRLHTFNVFMLEDKIQNPNKCLFRFSSGGNIMDQRSGNGRLGGRFFNHRAQFWRILISRILRCWMRGLQLWTRSSRIPTSRKRSVWGNRMPRKRVGSFAEDRSLTWSTPTSGLLALMIQHQIMLICSLLPFMIIISRVRYDMERNSLVYDKDPAWWHPGKFVQIKNTRVWST